MLHTVEFYININQREKQLMEELHGKRIKRVLREVENNYPEFRLRIGKPHLNKRHNIYLQIDAIELLKCEDGIITEADYEQVQERIVELEKILFGHLHLKFILNRIDYRLDVKVHSDEHRECLFKMWGKLASKYGHLTKRTKKKKFRKEGDRDIYIDCQQFKTTIYIASKALVVCVYDKGAERKAKNETIKTYEENVVRFEVRLMARHLAYKAREKKIKRTLKAYFRQDTFDYYIRKYVFGIFGTGHFNKINKVREQLADNGVKTKDQQELICFLKDVTKRGIEGAISYRENSKNQKGCSRYKFIKYKIILDVLGINMIMLPIREKVEGDVLMNPLYEVYLESFERLILKMLCIQILLRQEYTEIVSYQLTTLTKNKFHKL
ncbi:MAG: hypothetical protein J6F30_05105 [Cellulosilyticum sp.]|nr:hypothetical protein [Cellulosilyticum sp.]